MDRRYRETREAIDSGEREREMAVSRARLLKRNQGAFRDDSPVSRSNFSAAAKQGAIRQKEDRDSKVFSEYGSGLWGSGDEQINEVRRPVQEVRDWRPSGG